MAGPIAKPQLRGFVARYIRNSVIGACAASILTGILWKVFVMDARKAQYKNYYMNYDGEAKLKIMCDSGYMQSCGTYKLNRD